MSKQIAKDIVRRMIVAANVHNQEELARVLGIKPQSISSNIAKGKIPPRWFEEFERRYNVSKESLCQPLTEITGSVDILYSLISDDTDNDFNLQDMVNMAKGVLQSNTEYRSVLAANIRAFYQAVIVEGEVTNVRSEVDQMRKKLGEMESMIQNLQKQDNDKKKRAESTH